MKSIDEAGVEWHLSHPDADKEETWKAGANYVLDILKKELPLEDNRYLNDYGKALVWRLKECIEQLKK